MGFKLVRWWYKSPNIIVVVGIGKNKYRFIINRLPNGKYFFTPPKKGRLEDKSFNNIYDPNRKVMKNRSMRSFEAFNNADAGRIFHIILNQVYDTKVKQKRLPKVQKGTGERKQPIKKKPTKQKKIK